MKDFDDEYENTYFSEEETADKLDFNYQRIRKDTGRLEINLKIVMEDGRTLTFKPEDVELDEENNIITMCQELAIKKGLV